MEKNPNNISEKQFIEAMQNLLKSTNNEDLKKNEAILQQFTSQVNSLASLARTLNQDDLVVSIQQFIAILLKKSVINNFLQHTQQEQNEILKMLWCLYAKYESSQTILTQLSSSLSLIYQHQKKNLDNSPEVQSFLESNLVFNDKQKYNSAVILLTSIVDNCHDYFNSKQASSIINKILQVFSEQYNEKYNDVYVNSQKALCNFIRYYSETQEDTEADLKELLNSIINMSINLLKNQDFMIEQEKEYEQVLISFLDEIQQNLDIANQKFNIESLNLIFNFITNKDILLSQDINDNLKCSFMETLGYLNLSYPMFLNRNTSETNLNNTLDTLSQLALTEEKKYQERVQQNSQVRLNEFIQEGLINLIFYSLESILKNQKHQQVYQKIVQIRNLFINQNCPRLILMLTSYTCQQFSLFYAKEIEHLMRNFIFPSLDCQQEDLILQGLKTLLYFQEFLHPDILEYHQEILQFVLKFLNLAKNSSNQDQYQQKVIMNVLEQNMFLIEIILENLDDNELEQIDQQLMESIIVILQTTNQNQRIKKISLQALSAVFVSCQQNVMLKNMNQIIQILNTYLQDDFLTGVVLICFGRLCYYGLKNEAQKQQLFESNFIHIYKKCNEILSNTQDIVDYDLYEGALTFLYQTVYLFQDQSSFILNKETIFKWIDYIEEARPTVMIPQQIEDENQNLQEQLCNKLVQKLPFVYMISAAINLIGASLRYISNQIIIDDQSYNKIKQILFTKLLSENQDERHQSFIAIYQMVQGIYLTIQKDCSEDFIEAIKIVLNNELSDENVKRNMEQIVKYVDECSKFQGGYILYENEQFLQKLSQALNQFLKQQYDTDLNPELYIEISETVSKMSKFCNTNKFLEFIRAIYPAMMYPIVNNMNVDYMVFEEGFGWLGEIICNQPSCLQIFIQCQQQEDEFINLVSLALGFKDDENVQRNGVYTIGEIFDKMKLPYLNQQNKIEIIIKNIEQIYQNTQFVALKENCIATILKLYLNQQYQQINQNLFQTDKILNLCLQVLPLKEDKQESLIFIKTLLSLYSNEQVRGKILIPKLILFMIYALINEKDIRQNIEIMQQIKQMFSQIENEQAFANTIHSLDSDTRTELRNILQNNQLD